MDREVQEENSSFQNVNLEITHIERGRHGETTAFGFSDGSSFFIHPELAVKYSVRLGCIFSIEQINIIRLESIVFAARDKALEYLAAREHSSYEIVLKLRKKGYDQDSSKKAVNLLKKKGYLDDSRFAKMWLESRLKKHPEGRSALSAGLAKKGIPRQIIAKVLMEHFSHEREIQALETCIEKYNRKDSSKPTKLINHLTYRGFRYSDIKTKINETDKTLDKNKEAKKDE